MSGEEISVAVALTYNPEQGYIRVSAELKQRLGDVRKIVIKGVIIPMPGVLQDEEGG